MLYEVITLGNRPIEKLRRTLGVVATDLQSGEKMVFRSGNVGVAVRASSSVPGIFQPVRIGNREYVDGGLASPVPAEVAREMGADVVIAVDISSKPRITSYNVCYTKLLRKRRALARRRHPGLPRNHGDDVSGHARDRGGSQGKRGGPGWGCSG